MQEKRGRQRTRQTRGHEHMALDGVYDIFSKQSTTLFSTRAGHFGEVFSYDLPFTCENHDPRENSIEELISLLYWHHRQSPDPIQNRFRFFAELFVTKIGNGIKDYRLMLSMLATPSVTKCVLQKDRRYRNDTNDKSPY